MSPVPWAAAKARHLRTCDRVAANGGSDAAPGTLKAPFRTVQRVVESLRPGMVGCVRGGYYADEVNGPFVVNFFRGGRRGRRVTLRSFPGERAQLRGIVTISKGANYVTLKGFDLDGRSAGGHQQIGIQLFARRTVVSGNRITDPDASCMSLGTQDSGAAVRTVVTGNVFHDCGDPRNGLHEHAIYALDSRGGRITNNVIIRSAAFAVHFYGSNSGVDVEHNVMVANGGGVIFSGFGARTSSRNRVAHNIIAGSVAAPGIYSWWGGARGRGNVARSNCVAGNRGQEIDRAAGGFRASRNVAASPDFVNPAAGDLRLRAGSGCRRVVGYDTFARLLHQNGQVARAAVAGGR